MLAGITQNPSKFNPVTGQKANSDKQKVILQYMVDQGFKIICPVAANMATSYEGNSMIQNRLNLDGYTMLKHPERISKYFFDPAQVVDTARPPLN